MSSSWYRFNSLSRVGLRVRPPHSSTFFKSEQCTEDDRNTKDAEKSESKKLSLSHASRDAIAAKPHCRGFGPRCFNTIDPRKSFNHGNILSIYPEYMLSTDVCGPECGLRRPGIRDQLSPSLILRVALYDPAVIPSIDSF
jgi:hypothetical protein